MRQGALAVRGGAALFDSHAYWCKLTAAAKSSVSRGDWPSTVPLAAPRAVAKSTVEVATTPSGYVAAALETSARTRSALISACDWPVATKSPTRSCAACRDLLVDTSSSRAQVMLLRRAADSFSE